MKFFENMREKPKAERQRFAFVTALVVTSVIAFVWFSVSFLTTDNAETQIASAEGPIELIVDYIKKIFQ